MIAVKLVLDDLMWCGWHEEEGVCRPQSYLQYKFATGVFIKDPVILIYNITQSFLDVTYTIMLCEVAIIIICSGVYSK